MTTQGTEARRGETVGLDAKRDGLFGAADAPQLTDNAETIMTDVQQAVPVAQEEADAERIVEQHCEAWRWGPFDSFSGTAEWGLAVHSAAQGIATARQQFEQALAKEAKDWRHSAYSRATFAALSASHPCKSGEGAARERIAQIIRGHMPSHWCDEDALRTEAYSTALADAIFDATQTREAEGEQFAKIAECAFDDRPRSRVGHPSQMDWEDGYRDGTRAAATAIRADLNARGGA